MTGFELRPREGDRPFDGPAALERFRRSRALQGSPRQGNRGGPYGFLRVLQLQRRIACQGKRIRKPPSITKTRRRSHRTAADHHGKGDHAKGHEESTKAHAHAKTAREHSEGAHSKSQSNK